MLHKKLQDAELNNSEEKQYKPKQNLNVEKTIEILEETIRQKDFQIAKLLKDTEDKSRILKLLREKLNEAEFNPKINKKYWNEMDRLLDIHLENNMHSFEIQLDEMHQVFFGNLHKRFPDLSVYDLRLCGYIKIGMNTKEIAELLHVLPSSINVSRSRLRKKLSLTPDEDLFSFLQKFH
ncbi:MAG: hypothetical protein R2774_13710 [Saprospiraceae bacterium]